ncbi:MAG: hypothetical protein GX184_01380 [Clostridiaceae bacterium]|mgnify:CR=1 FL=1|nr:hypothetical protein [Clostridiaceae bacterium]
MIVYRRGHDIDMIRLIELFEEAGYKDKTGDFNKLLNMVESSAEVITAWDFDYMIGFINSNGGEKAEYVLVDPEYSEMGIDKELISRINSFGS